MDYKDQIKYQALIRKIAWCEQLIQKLQKKQARYQKRIEKLFNMQKDQLDLDI